MHQRPAQRGRHLDRDDDLDREHPGVVSPCYVYVA